MISFYKWVENSSYDSTSKLAYLISQQAEEAELLRDWGQAINKHNAAKQAHLSASNNYKAYDSNDPPKDLLSTTGEGVKRYWDHKRMAGQHRKKEMYLLRKKDVKPIKY